MKAEAEANAEADKKETERIEVMNQTDALIFRAENFIKESGDKISEEKKTEVEHDIDALRNARDEQDVESCKACMEILSKALMEIGAEFYKTFGASNNPFGQFFGDFGGKA
jgi:molecular chaperone DnaK